MVLSYVALGVIAFLIVMLAAIIVQLGSLPGKIAHRRGHPQADAVNAASWISFVTLGALWPLAFVWAFFKDGSSSPDQQAPDQQAPDQQASGQQTHKQQSTEAANEELEKLASRLAALEATVSKLQTKS
jgi:hypothetical protein